MARVRSFLLAILMVPFAAAAQPPVDVQPRPGMPMPPRDTTARTGTARIRGHVFAAENGTPLRKAQVRVASAELRENRVTTTDAQGAFEFKDLPAGRYTVTASKGSFVMLQFGQTRPLQQGKPIEILDGQTIEKIDFALPRGSIITGRVVDEYGEPIADVQVAPMRYQFVQGRRRLVPTGRGSQTNDIGEYRLYGLAPGQYYISATLRNFMFMSADSDDRSGYSPTYYPGTANPSEAQRISVELGQTLSDVNLALVATRTAKISGFALDSQGRPLSMGMVMAMPRTGMMFGPAGNGQIKPDGSFTLSGMAPGEYTLRANTPPSGDGAPEFATADVTVNGEDVNGIRLAMAKMIIASGRVVFTDPAAAQSVRPNTLRLMGMPANQDEFFMMMGPGGGGTVKDDYSFELRMPPGRLLIRTAGPPLQGLALKAVRQNGLDVTDTGIDFTAGNDVGGLEVEFTNRLSEISGLVTNSRGEAVKDYSVLVFSEDRDRWASNTRYRGVGRPDQEGRFKIRTLPPGRYYIIALDYMDASDSGDPEFLDRIRTKAATFSLGDGETKVVDLKVQTAS